jgi:hypothetical protein
MQPVKSMFMTTSTWEGGKYQSFKLIPITKDCPFSEVFFDPFAKVLVVTGSQLRDQFTVVHKLDRFGEVLDPVPVKNPHTNQKELKYQKDRVKVQGFKEYYIDRPNEIENFIELFALNAESFDFTQYLKGELIPVAETAPEKETNTATADLS